MMFKISDLTLRVALTLTSFFVSASAKKSNANVNGPFDGIATVFDVPDNYTGGCGFPIEKGKAAVKIPTSRFYLKTSKGKKPQACTRNLVFLSFDLIANGTFFFPVVDECTPDECGGDDILITREAFPSTFDGDSRRVQWGFL